MKILAADDNRTNLHILQVFLKKLGHDVILAENGDEAVRRFVADKPDLILLDIMMPVMDGFEAARRIKALATDRWTPIIFLSALNRDENLVEGLNAGADDYLTKPINFVVLEAKLRSMQRSLSMQQQAMESLRRVQAISDNVVDGIVTIDGRGIIVSANQAAERMFGWRAAELVGRNVSMLVPEPHRARHDQYIAARLAGRPAIAAGVEREVEAVRKSGAHFPATLSISDITLDNQPMFIGVVRDISERRAAQQKLRDSAAQLQAYYEQTQNEQQLALRLLERQLHRRGLKDPRLQYKVIPAENFSGDVVAAARSPEGRFYALLADATGHGLTAAISVLPVLALFYRMTKLNRSVQEIVVELNQQLKEAMPLGRFVAATVVCLDEVARRGEIWVGGTPEPLLFDQAGHLARRFPSESLPLGIVDNADAMFAPVKFAWEAGGQLLVCSDGLLEAANVLGEQFGSERLARVVAEHPAEARFAAVDAALRDHLGGMAATDDVSLLLIDCP